MNPLTCRRCRGTGQRDGETCEKCNGEGETESRSLPIPVRMSDTGAPGTRSCTMDFKIRVIGKWLKEHGATAETPATVGIGFSTDEMHRANRKRAHDYEDMTGDGQFDLRSIIERYSDLIRPLQPRWWELRSRWSQWRALCRTYGRREARRLLRLLRQGPPHAAT